MTSWAASRLPAAPARVGELFLRRTSLRPEDVEADPLLERVLLRGRDLERDLERDPERDLERDLKRGELLYGRLGVMLDM